MGYRGDGYLVVRSVMDPDEVEACRAHLSELAGRAGLASGALVVVPAGDPFVTGLAGDSRLVSIAADALSGEGTVFGSTYIVKEPLVGPPALWHQDGYPWQTGLGVTEAVTLWIALDDADAANGAMKVIPGSHRLPAQPLQPMTDVANMFGHQLDPALVDESLAVQLEMASGDVSAHHSCLVHSSGPNRSDRPRRALAIRYRAPV